jgi:L-fuconolactonase
MIRRFSEAGEDAFEGFPGIMKKIDRRTFLKSSAGAALGSLAGQNSFALPQLDTIIDTHVHFYDPSRPGGVPWPPKDETALYRTVLPADYKRVTAAFNIKGVIEVEASPLVEDNQWVLDLARREPIILGTCGHLEIGSAGFGDSLERFHKKGRFLGIRIGSTWGSDLRTDLRNPYTISNLKLLAQAGLEADVLGGPGILEDVVQISDKVPDLRIVIEHMPFNAPDSDLERAKTSRVLSEMKDRPQVFCKVSNVLRRVDGRLQTDDAYYRPGLEELWEVFGAERLIYGSNWPVSDNVGPYDLVFQVVRNYFGTKGMDASQKFFSSNSKIAYRWTTQPR